MHIVTLNHGRPGYIGCSEEIGVGKRGRGEEREEREEIGKSTAWSECNVFARAVSVERI